MDIPTTIDVELVTLMAPSSSDTGTLLPPSITNVGPGSTYYVEIWAQQTAGSEGIQGGAIDVRFSPDTQAAFQTLYHGGIYTVLTTGSFVAPDLIDDLGGATFSGGVGVAPEWARLGYIEMHAAGEDEITYTLEAAGFQFSLSGVGNVPWSDVDLDSLSLNADPTPPTVDSFSPSDDATGVAVGANLVIDFSENVQKGTGNIVIRKSSDDSVVETIAVSSSQVTISSDMATIDPSSDLAEGTGYYVQVDSGALEDLAGNDYGGITDKTTWNFSTGTMPLQIVSGAPDARRIRPGQQFGFDVEYHTSDGDNTLLGLGLRMHYNSSVLTFNGFVDVLPTGLFEIQQQPMPDTEDYDGDPDTDKYLLTAWVDVDGNWPNETLPVQLFTPSFTLASATPLGISTTVRFSASSTAPSRLFSSEPVEVTAVSINLDVDGDGSVSDETDGKLIMKYMFGFRDSSIILPEIVQLLDGAVSSVPNPLNPDGSSAKVADALSDGVLIRRYLQGGLWKGPDLIKDVLTPPPTWEEIWDFLDSFNPMNPATGQGLVAAMDDSAESFNSRTETVAGAQAIEAAGPFLPGYVQPLIAEVEEESDTLIADFASTAVGQQELYPDEVPPVNPGSQVAVHVNYTTDPEDATLTGLGVRVHYNSSLLEQFDGFSGVLPTGFFEEDDQDWGGLLDSEDYDDDPDTDRYVLISWADLDGNWPGQLGIPLFTANWKSSTDAKDSTWVNFTSSSTAADWDFYAESAKIAFLPKNGSLSGYVYIDANGNGKYDYIDANDNGQYDPGEVSYEGLPGVIVKLDGPEPRTTTTDDSGYYEFTGLPGGTYAIEETHPAACLDGNDYAGTIGGKTAGEAHNPGDLIDQIELPADEHGTDYIFIEAAVRPECIPNRILATSTQPVGSPRWYEVIREMIVREQASGTSPTAATPTDTVYTLTVQNPREQLSSEPQHAAQAMDAVDTVESVSIAVPTAAAATDARTTINVTDLEPIVTEAIAEWREAGAPPQAVDAMKDVPFSVTDLAASYLGWSENGQVVIDLDAADHGWFVDPTPEIDEEFEPSEAEGQLRTLDPQVVDRMDLLTVVAHELGHIAGLKDLDFSDGLMSDTLSKGIRRKPGLEEIDALFALYEDPDWRR